MVKNAKTSMTLAAECQYIYPGTAVAKNHSGREWAPNKLVGGVAGKVIN
jgi:hypothetical protein